jgi:p-aminobenzoyl-glutamate transporter AbgT
MITVLLQNKLCFIVSLLCSFNTIHAKHPKGIQKFEINNLISIENLEMSICNSGQKFKI